MSYKLSALPSGFRKEGPIVLCILDGYGLGKDDPSANPIVAAHPTYINDLIEKSKSAGLYKQIRAHGPAVGLPSESDMGNSEVGHNAMGAGQIYSQGTMLVDESFKTGRMFKTENWKTVVGETASHSGTLHMFGLLSDGNIHSHIGQVEQLIDGAVETGIKTLRIHVLLDGRDVPPESGLKYIDMIEAKLASLAAKGVDAKIASGGGRMYVTMDRYNSDWNIVRRGWNSMVHGIVEEADISDKYKGYYHSAREAIEACRAAFPDKKDQYNLPFVIVDEAGSPIGKMKDGDAVINWNFRGDRAIQISKAFELPDTEFTFFDRGTKPKVRYAGLLEYDTEVHIPSQFLVPPPEISHTLSQYLLASGVPSYAIAETHKFGHVTFFWNGNKSGYIDEAHELYEVVPSLPNSETETHPEMKAKEVTDKLVAALESKKYRFLRVNYANGDMVGHTGNFDSCVKCVQCLDREIARLDAAVRAQNGILIITADHGNVEDKDHKGSKTSHTCAPVLFSVTDYTYKGEYTLIPDTVKPDGEGKEGSGLSNIAATVMNLLGFEAPDVYRKSMIQFK
ncbi:2,3-bisphosphoglycerate independent phosphoglycerate mutase (iPGM) [Monocercomonoides exilis]|uniref:phosphoglycerate mutase (2,3-diphosphoglycerate-independent) n=1 Tax=Monocercomonoides exilis TaxID=2049356 RepID=A1BQS9_9EUKA|nr:phosphoglycerate mutase [Monocercomonoides exilis]KAH7816109.1 2,3-bisphosphoglycerate independent phosphoglycerate mutase (iPGM) [Monocercomonoides exilis]|eukprot:MONOS_5139.1-p1 / transcript=MONOS_5139.1 / gene=MONOS_5139 / organism=Monocercomonoides_exilis_PA203 / gene_product=2,3-bisphosphoglycerate independent phosphoglycerate mutase (iPGM) / transcript_product=2,3-bisphosphoglycerate independent phosphoglycerate mutase (iPGM) / location=Mono_scaffold00146:74590-76371(+) / protein_length=565 / sequence_SO=supercontig / SO=protein_coding / is_pseudo=false